MYFDIVSHRQLRDALCRRVQTLSMRQQWRIDVDDKKPPKKKTGVITMRISAKERDEDPDFLHVAELKLTATKDGRVAVILTGETASLASVGSLLTAYTAVLESSETQLTFTPVPTEEPTKKDPPSDGGASG